jgi:stage V sporulation protein G
MEITEVRIKLMEDSDDRLQAFCSITFDDCFVVRDLKIIDGSNGPFVAMPSRKLTGHCPKCGCKNHLRAAYCNQCGQRLEEERAARDPEGRVKLYADVAHPINANCRELIQERVIAEFRYELDRSQQPGYVSRYDDDYEDASCPTAPGNCHCHGSSEAARYQTAESLPRRPHLQTAQPGKLAENGQQKRVKGEFGAGIFD